MPWSLFDVLFALPAYALVLFRIGGLVLTAPVFGSTLVPLRVRAGMVMVIAAMVFPLVAGQAPRELSLSMAVVGGVREFMIGATIGLSLSILLSSAEVVGLMVGRQAGLALANVFDPTRNQQTTTVGQVYSMVLVLVFLTAGGHRAAMAAVLDTFAVIPLLSSTHDESAMVLLAELLGAAFILGIRLAVPVLIALFLTGTALGFLSRTMPQLNILTVGFTLRVLVALAVAGLALDGCRDLLLNAVWDAVELIRTNFGLDPSAHRLVE